MCVAFMEGIDRNKNIYVYLCIYVSIGRYVYICLCIYTCLDMYLHVYRHINNYIYVYLNIHTFIFKCKDGSTVSSVFFNFYASGEVLGFFVNTV